MQINKMFLMHMSDVLCCPQRRSYFILHWERYQINSLDVTYLTTGEDAAVNFLINIHLYKTELKLEISSSYWGGLYLELSCAFQEPLHISTSYTCLKMICIPDCEVWIRNPVVGGYGLFFVPLLTNIDWTHQIMGSDLFKYFYHN